MTDFTLTLAGPRGDSAADLARRLGLVASTASDTEALLAILNRTVSAAAASTGNVSLSSAPATLDGVTLANGDRVLLHAQTAPAENGIYVFTSAGAALTRWSGANEWHELPGLTVGVAGGSTHANTAWTCFSAHGGTLGTTAVTFLKLAGSLNALLALANTWSNLNTFSAGVNVTGDKLRVGTTSNTHGSAVAIDKAATTIQAYLGPHYNGGVAYNAGDKQLIIGAWSGKPMLRLVRNNVNGLYLTIESDGSITWSDGSGERMRLTGGNLGIGTAAPAAGLDVARDALKIGAGGSRQGIGLGDSGVGLDAGGVYILRSNSGMTAFGNILHLGGYDGVTIRTADTPGAPATARLTVNGTGHVLPGADNAQTLGGASNRWSTVYAGTGTINTSDAAEKSEFSAIPDGVKAAARALMGQLGVFQWLAAISRKGEDGARLHLGLKAQDVRDTFLAEGEDPNRWGLFCEDPILAPVEKTRSVERQITREVLRPRETVTVEGGQAVLRVVEETVEEPVFEAVPLVAADGTPIMREVKTVGPDGQSVVVMEPASHMAPVMETVEETYAEMEPTGETRLGLRHDQLMMLFIAVMAADRG